MAAKKQGQPVKTKKTAESAPPEKSKFQFAQAKVFLTEVKAEFGKIVWPEKKHTLGSTLVVTILVMIIAFYLGAVDLILGKMIGFIFK